MQVLKKIKTQGLGWFFSRFAAELVMPKSKLGLRFGALSKINYLLISKPVQYISALSNQYQRINADTLYFFYDLEVEPITFDFAWALSIAEAKRKQLNLKYLKIIIVPGKNDGLRVESADYEKIVSKGARIWRLHAIVIPIVQLVSSKTNLYICSSRQEAALIKYTEVKHQYPVRYTVEIPIPYSPEDVMLYGHDVLYIQPLEQAFEYIQKWKKKSCAEKKLITITIRQYAFGLDRNSNLDAWISFAKSVDSTKFKVVFVPDNDMLYSDIQAKLNEFECFEAACWSIPLRAALYESAYLNLGVNTGPMALCWFSPNCRYITFKTVTESVPQSTKEVMLARDFVENESPKFAKPFQKWSWLNDNYENIVKEFKKMLMVLEKL